MTLSATDTGLSTRVGILDHIAVRGDMANSRMPSPWVIGFGIVSVSVSVIMALPIAKVTGSPAIATILPAAS